MHRVDLETGDIIPLTPGPGVRSYLQQLSVHFPDELLVAHNQRDKRYFEHLPRRRRQPARAR